MKYKNTYGETVQIVGTFDKEAEHYLRNDVHDLEHFDPHYSLNSSFIFSSTPQGSNYWFGITRKIQQFKDLGKEVPSPNILPDNMFEL